MIIQKYDKLWNPINYVSSISHLTNLSQNTFINKAVVIIIIIIIRI